MKQTNRLTYIVKIAMLGVLAYVVMFLEFALPVFPSFLKMDFSDLIPLLGSLALGPVAGILSELIKNLLHLLTASHTGGVGELANFVVGSAFCATAGLYYQHHKTKKGAIVSLALSAVAMIVAMTAGVVQLNAAQQETAELVSYIDTLKNENAALEKTYRESYNLAEIGRYAEAMGLVPISQVEQLEISVQEPPAPEQNTPWEEFCIFLAGLFA